LNSPKNTVVTAGIKNFASISVTRFNEQDKLYEHLFADPSVGENFLEFTYDFHGQSTFAYANTPSNVTVPNSANRYSTFSLTGSVHPTQKLSVDFALYNTTWTIHRRKSRG